MTKAEFVKYLESLHDDDMVVTRVEVTYDPWSGMPAHRYSYSVQPEDDKLKEIVVKHEVFVYDPDTDKLIWKEEKIS